MAVPWKLLFKGGGILTQAADALLWPDQAGYGSDVVRAVDEAPGDPAYLRKLHVVWTRGGGAGRTDDVALCTWHLAKLAGEDYTSNWITADYVAAEARFNTWWAAFKVTYPASTILAQYRWYKSGPAFPVSGPPVRITLPAVAGTSVASMMPPQVSINVTEKTRIRKSWGRFYLPACAVSVYDADGRHNATNIGTPTGALYNGLSSDGIPVHVYSTAKPPRKTKSGADLPASPARALRVESIVCDDIPDVIRSRRYKTATARATVAIT
jgi:hypothetical protein